MDQWLPSQGLGLDERAQEAQEAQLLASLEESM